MHVRLDLPGLPADCVNLQVAAEPEVLPGLAVRWLAHALASPVQRADWVGSDREPSRAAGASRTPAR
jgi:hypothetical protein